FVDGQALYRSSKEAFGYTHPNYDVQKLTDKIAAQKDWQVAKIYFYTGIPERSEDQFWHGFWVAKLAVMGTRRIGVFTRPLRYADQKIECRHCHKKEIVRVAREKGIDVRLALDVVRLALHDSYDVGLIFSQDQDLSEVVDEVRELSKRQKRWIKLASAYPVSASYANGRGINGMAWIPIDKSLYDSCIDPADYRPRDVFNPAFP
ncbi:MAG: NYN domain-containing protein, partial [bacterium]